MMMTAVFGQSLDQRIDSLILAKTMKPFNGIIYISQDGKTKYSKAFGYSDLESEQPLKLNDEYIVSMNFYFPKTKISIVVLENIAYCTYDLKKTFYYHTAILQMIREEQKNYR
jgi:hypothetical protein